MNGPGARIWRSLALALSVLAALACGSGNETPGGLQVERAEIGLMPGDGPAVAYVMVTNSGPEGDRLVAVESSLASQAELHESIDEDGVVRMIARPEGFEVPAGGALTLEPGGKHIMLFDPRRDQVADGRATLTLHFEIGGAREVQASVLQVGSGGNGADHGAMDHSQMDHGDVDHDSMDHDSMDHDSMDHDSMDHDSMDHGSVDHGDPEASGADTDSQDGSISSGGKEAPGA